VFFVVVGVPETTLVPFLYNTLPTTAPLYADEKRYVLFIATVPAGAIPIKSVQNPFSTSPVG
jgi:hypothetical protein